MTAIQEGPAFTMLATLTTLTTLAEIRLLDFVPFLGVLCLVAWMMLALRKKRMKNGQAHSKLTGDEQIERHRQARGLRGDLEEVMVEVEQLARRFSAQLDAKTMVLEKLLDEADQRIARLEEMELGLTRQFERRPGEEALEPREAKTPTPRDGNGAGRDGVHTSQESHVGVADVQPTPPPAPPPAPPADVDRVDPAVTPAPAPAPAPSPSTSSDNAPHHAPASAESPSPAPSHSGAALRPVQRPQPREEETQNAGAGADPLTQAIYRMADGGSNPVEIARSLNEHVGKVELILALRRTPR